MSHYGQYRVRLIFMDFVHTSRMLASAPESMSQAAINHLDKPTVGVDCGLGTAYNSCLSKPPILLNLNQGAYVQKPIAAVIIINE